MGGCQSRRMVQPPPRDTAPLSEAVRGFPFRAVNAPEMGTLRGMGPRGIEMAGDGRRSTATQTSRLLRELLLSRPEYRRRWQERSRRRRSDSINRAGVAQVVALYLWGSGERPDSMTSLPRHIKDRIRRALAGESITPQTLTWFVEAFDMDRHDEDSLWAAFAGDRDMHAGISYTITRKRDLALRQRHRTIALFARYSIAADHGFIKLRSSHMIMALGDGVDVYPFTTTRPCARSKYCMAGHWGLVIRTAAA
jgi:uncharacterized protein YneR